MGHTPRPRHRHFILRHARVAARPARLYALLAAMTLTAVTASPAGSSGTVLDERGCTAIIASATVPVERVEPLVPDPFPLRQDVPGQASLGVYAVHCEELTIHGLTREVTWAAFRVLLAGEPEGSEEAEAASSRPPLPLHDDTYQFFIAYDDRELVRLYREVGATPSEAVFVEDLDFDLDLESGTFSFEAPPPTPSPFKITAQVDEAPVGPFDLEMHEWGTAPRGLFVVGDPNDISLRIGPARGSLEVEAGSEMAQVLCDPDDKISWENLVGGIAAFEGHFTVRSVDLPDRHDLTTKPAPSCE